MSSKMNRLRVLSAMLGAVAIGADAINGDPMGRENRDSYAPDVPNPKGLLQNADWQKGRVPTGCKKFYFNEKGELMPEIKVGLTSFICHAYNEPSARKKFQKWQDKRNA